MNFEALKEKIEQERQIDSRFPVRAILCRTLKEYDAVTSFLTQCCDFVWELGDFCGADDLHPRFKKARDRLDAEANGKFVALLSVGEYLRIASKRECGFDKGVAKFDVFWRRAVSVNSSTRVFAPILDAEDLLVRALHPLDERQRDFIWRLDDELPPVSCAPFELTVCSYAFQDVADELPTIHGVKNWLLKWRETMASGKRKLRLTTKLFEDCDACQSDLYAVDVLASPYDALSNFDKSVRKIPRETLNDEFWADLFSKISPAQKNVKSLILNALNLQSFNATQVLARWQTATEREKQYVWLWFQLEEKIDDYVGAIFAELAPNELEKLPYRIANRGLTCVGKPKWLKGRRDALQYFDVAPNDDFFRELDATSSQLAFELLTDRTPKEKAYIVKTTGRLLREAEETAQNEGQKIDDAVARRAEELIVELRKRFPRFDLTSYLETSSETCGDWAGYFAWYKQRKLIDRPVTALPDFPDVEALPSRYSLLKKYEAQHSHTIWIDGLGAEYLSLTLAVLNEKKTPDVCVKTHVAASVIPSTTELNSHWLDASFHYEKHDRLDQISHSGLPDDGDFYSCCVAQMQAVREITENALAQLDKFSRVIITGDHGSSRLAALAFHAPSEPPLELPPNATVKRLGRYCELSPESQDANAPPSNIAVKTINDKTYYILKDYGRYKCSGYVVGELHGGATPEE
ncbi:MAG: BREX-4 system phosphatase PglZ, partial [Thermoguttaceae bacterium]|nr:BREX-4 system phosphatase PglZ [Thermoguttaceae bacterium]